MAVTLTLPRPRFTLSDRNLIERRLRQPQGNSTRYRNLLQLQYPFVVRGRHLTLLVSDEVSYESAVKAWVRNRFLAGIRKQLNNYCSADFYYLKQNDGRARALRVISTLSVSLSHSGWEVRLLHVIGSGN